MATGYKDYMEPYRQKSRAYYEKHLAKLAAYTPPGKYMPLDMTRKLSFRYNADKDRVVAVK